MSTTIKVGTCEPWVTTEWVKDGEAFAVKCERCGGTDFAYTVWLKRNPGGPARWVLHHNECKAKEAA